MEYLKYHAGGFDACPPADPVNAAMSRHTLAIRVNAADIDRMDHVNNSVYLRWVEEAVHTHWAALATPDEFAAYRWLAVRHEIDYRRPALVGDQLQVETRITAIRRVRAWYETIIRRDDVQLVEARSCWCCVDAATHALTVIPADMAARFLPDQR
jgi:acyl-CoA thioester hydrolase